jgi:hypothetical protein
VGTVLTQIGAGSNSSLQGSFPADIIGGYRAQFLNVGAGGTQVNTTLVNPGTGDFSMSIGAGDDGSATLTYDANGAGLGSLGNFLTFLGGGANASNTYFQAAVKFSDQNLVFTASFTDTGNDTATFVSLLGPGISFVNQAFGSFSNAGAVDFDNISKIQIRLDGPLAQDVKIGLLEITNTPETSTPEPASMALLGSALAGLGMFGRKKLTR